MQQTTNLKLNIAQDTDNWLDMDKFFKDNMNAIDAAFGRLGSDVTQFGADPFGLIDSTAAFQAAIDAANHVYVPSGIYLVDPSIGIKLKTGTVIRGAGDANTILLAKNGVGGSVFKRSFNPAGPNAYVQDVFIGNLAVVLTHPATADPSNYEQIAYDFRNITRSTLFEVYGGNANRGSLGRVNSSQPNLCQGYGIVFGTVSSSNPAYCGGEVNTAIRCTVQGVKKAVVTDDATLSPLSAAHATMVHNCDVQVCESGIVQELRYGAGVQFRDNIVQAVQRATGSANTTYAYRLEGMGGRISGGYVEAASADNHIYLGALSKRNVVEPMHISGTAIITNNGTDNNVSRMVDNVGRKESAKTTFDNGILLGTSTNALTVYEEGTFTPTAYGATTAGATTYSSQVGNYTRVGRLVTANLYINCSAMTGTGGIRIGDLPYTSKNVSGAYNAGAVFHAKMNVSNGVVMAYLPPNSKEIVIRNNALDATSVDIPVEANGIEIMISITYMV